MTSRLMRWLVLACLLAGLVACGGQSGPAPAVTRLLPAPGARLVVAPRPARVLWRWGAQLPPHELLRELPGYEYHEPIPPLRDEAGRFVLERASSQVSGRPRFAQIREQLALEEAGRSLLGARLNVDGGAEVSLSGQLLRRDGTPAQAGDARVRLLQFAGRPRNLSAALADANAGALLLESGLELGAEGQLEGRLVLERGCRALVFVLTPGARDVAVVSLTVRDTGRGGEASVEPLSLVVYGEVRPGLTLTAGSTLSLPLPAWRPARLALGLSALSRPGRAQISVRAGDQLLWEDELESPPTMADERWLDRALDLPAAGADTLTISLESVDGRAVALGLAVPRLLPAAAAVAADPRPNLVLISVDTLRRDALGFAGGHPDASPALDAFAARGLVFDQALSASAYTLPAHASLLSGQQPTVHGAEGRTESLVPGRTQLVAQSLADAGYLTAAFTGGGFLNHRFGFAQGFDRYVERDFALPVSDEPLDWLSSVADQRFFLFLHTFAAHHSALNLPTDYVERFDVDCQAPELHDREADWEVTLEGNGAFIENQRMQAHLERCYVAGVRLADDSLARFFARLEALGLTDDTVVIVTSDHGQEIGERGYFAHGNSLYEEMLRVPLIVAGPGVQAAGRVESSPVGGIDVTPTLLELGGAPAHVNMHGRSLVPLLRGEQLPEVPLISKVDADASKRAIRYRGHKLIHGPPGDYSIPNLRTWELFDLERDPDELRNLIGAERSAPIEGSLRVLLEQALSGWEAQAELLERRFGDTERALTAEDIEQLKQLGYVEGG